MRFSWKIVGVLIALIVVALTGLVILQASLLKSAMTLKEQAFRQNIFATLNAIVQKLEMGEMTRTAFDVFQTDRTKKADVMSRIRIYASMDTGVSLFDSAVAGALESCGPSKYRVEDDTLYYDIIKPQWVKISGTMDSSRTVRTLVDTFQTPGNYKIHLPPNCELKGFLVGRNRNDSVIIGEPAQNDTAISVIASNMKGTEKHRIVELVVNNLTAGEHKPIEERIKPAALDSVIAAAMKESNIPLSYAYGIISQKHDSLVLSSSMKYENALQQSEFKTRLFPTDIFAPPSELALYFPGYKAYIRQQMTPLLIMTVLFMLIIVGCFAYTIRTIYRQKQFAGRTVDFINNMTHEFKTPISTIALAGEALMRKDVAGDEARVFKFSTMIKDEIGRMRGQVEKILQMSMLEEKDYELTLTEIDAHEIIQKAAESLTLHVGQRGGAIRCQLEAPYHTILADSVHFENIIHNLLENANKYSPENPDITISTVNRGGGLVMSIRDRGIGISEKDKRLVFEKYYRVSSGDIQNVRGFGIGLAYVKLMVEVMGGKVNIDSTLGQGTTVEIFMPLSTG